MDGASFCQDGHAKTKFVKLEDDQIDPAECRSSFDTLRPSFLQRSQLAVPTLEAYFRTTLPLPLLGVGNPASLMTNTRDHPLTRENERSMIQPAKRSVLVASICNSFYWQMIRAHDPFLVILVWCIVGEKPFPGYVAPSKFNC